MARVTKAFRGIRAGDRYETDISIGEECPAELLEYAKMHDCLETEAEEKLRLKMDKERAAEAEAKAKAAAEANAEPLTSADVNTMTKAELLALVEQEKLEIPGFTKKMKVDDMKLAIINIFWPAQA